MRTVLNRAGLAYCPTIQTLSVALLSHPAPATRHYIARQSLAKLVESTHPFANVAKKKKGLTMNIPRDFPGRYLCTKEAAQILGLSKRTLEKHRVYGTGPQFSKLGGRVVYKIEDLHSWASRGSRRSTSDEGQGIVLPAKRHDPDVIARALGTPKPEHGQD